MINRLKAGLESHWTYGFLDNFDDDHGFPERDFGLIVRWNVLIVSVID